jgi:hypothetical protein
MQTAAPVANSPINGLTDVASEAVGNDMPGEQFVSSAPGLPPQHDLTAVVVPLLKGVLYRDEDPTLWAALLKLQPRVRDHMAVLALDVHVDEGEGYAFLRARPDGDDAAPKLPRLVRRQPLSFQVSLLLALLRKKLAEFDAAGGDTRLILSRDAVLDLVRVFMPEGSNDSRLVDQVETQLTKVVELGFVRRLKTSGAQAPMYEVRRILKAYVDAQWLAEFDQRLATYQQHLGTDTADNRTDADEVSAD